MVLDLSTHPDWNCWILAHILPPEGLQFHGRLRWHENDLPAGVTGQGVRARLRYRALVSHEETGEGGLVTHCQ